MVSEADDDRAAEGPPPRYLEGLPRLAPGLLRLADRPWMTPRQERRWEREVARLARIVREARQRAGYAPGDEE